MTKIYLVRHAEAEGNIYRRAHGQFNGLITGRGYMQIDLLKKRFEGVHVDAVYSSDLFRARTTATAVSDPRGLPVHTTEKLREVGMGRWEDTAWGNMEHFDHEMSKNFSHDPANWNVSGSEPYDNVQKRMYDFITETAKSHDGETISFFSHGFAIRSLMCLLMDIPSNETVKMPYCDNTAVAYFEYENDEIKIIFHSDNSHLNTEMSTLAHQTWWRTERRYVSENLRIVPLEDGSESDLLSICQADIRGRFAADREYLAYIGDVPAGIVGLDSSADGNGESVGILSYVYVREDMRKKTYGVQLLGQAVADFRKLRREKLRVGLPPDNSYMDFFLHNGFTVISESDGCRVMEKDIRNW